MSMASDDLAERIRALIGNRPGYAEMRMFGGHGFLLHGNMIAGAMSTGALLLRVGAALHAEAKSRPGAAPMVHGGREMTGFVEVDGDAVEDEEALAGWLAYAEGFVGTLPPKEAKVKPTKPKPAGALRRSTKAGR